MSLEEWQTEHNLAAEERTATAALEAKMSLQILPLAVGMRSDFSAPQLPDADGKHHADQFWMSTPAVVAAQHADCPQAIVSTYYKRGLVHNNSGYSMLLPCTGVVGTRVVLCFELNFNVGGIIVYRDLLTTLDVVLRDALTQFSVVQGLAHDVSYSYTGHTPEAGWHVIPIAGAMLDMCLYQVLRLPSVLDCNRVDYFRLSPMGVDESPHAGTWEALL
jgi:hypothetical protein